MKKVVLHILSLKLALILLVSSVGFSFNKMTCLSSGNVEFSFAKSEDCCIDEEVFENYSTSINEECCDFTSYLIKLNINSIVNLDFKKSVNNLFLWMRYPNYLTSFVHPSVVINFLNTSLPPPLKGIALFKLNSTFRI